MDADYESATNKYVDQRYHLKGTSGVGGRGKPPRPRPKPRLGKTPVYEHREIPLSLGPAETLTAVSPVAGRCL